MTCYNRKTMLPQTPIVDDFWTHEIPLFDGVFHYYHDKPRPVRGKIHTSDERYELHHSEAERDIRPIPTRRGTRTYVMAHTRFW